MAGYRPFYLGMAITINGACRGDDSTALAGRAAHGRSIVRVNVQVQR